MREQHAYGLHKFRLKWEIWMSAWVRRCCIALTLIISAAAYGNAAQRPATISHIEFDGNRRVRSETLQALIFTRPGELWHSSSLYEGTQLV